MGRVITEKPEARFDRFVKRADGRWLWRGGISSNGYGGFWFCGKTVLAHRFSYEKERGPIGEGMTLDHLCKVRTCVNPSHLDQCSLVDNVMRGDSAAARNARKTHCIRGHELSNRNLGVTTPKTVRRCKTCHRETEAARRQARKAG